jgi:hypothetical protein
LRKRELDRAAKQDHLGSLGTRGDEAAKILDQMYPNGILPTAAEALHSTSQFAASTTRCAGRPYRAGRSPDWVKVKNRKHPAMHSGLWKHSDDHRSP